MANPIDKYLAIDVLKAEVDGAHKQAKADADDFLADARDKMGVMGLTPQMLEGCGEYRYAATKAKKLAEYNVCDQEDFSEWKGLNPSAAWEYVAERFEDWAKWYFNRTGEVPDGVSRVEREVPAGYGPPKFYRVDAEKVKSILSDGVSFFEGTSRLLLGDGDE